MDKQMTTAFEHIALTEEHMSHLCQAFGNYTNKSAKLRNAYDDLASALHKFSGSDSVDNNTSLKRCLQLVSDSVATFGDLRDRQVTSLNRNVVKKLSQFGPICKRTRNDIKSFEKSHKSISKLKSLERVLTRHSVTSDNLKGGEDSVDSVALTDCDNVPRELEESLLHFEDNKLTKMKAILKDFISAELLYHCKAIEVLTEASNSVNDFNDIKDIQEFESRLKIEANLVETNRDKSKRDSHICLRSSERSLENSPGPGSYYQHRVIGGPDEDSSLEYATESSHA